MNRFKLKILNLIKSNSFLNKLILEKTKEKELTKNSQYIANKKLKIYQSKLIDEFNIKKGKEVIELIRNQKPSQMIRTVIDGIKNGKVAFNRKHEGQIYETRDGLIVYGGPYICYISELTKKDFYENLYALNDKSCRARFLFGDSSNELKEFDSLLSWAIDSLLVYGDIEMYNNEVNKSPLNFKYSIPEKLISFDLENKLKYGHLNDTIQLYSDFAELLEKEGF